jgi:hypothetical protein
MSRTPGFGSGRAGWVIGRVPVGGASSLYQVFPIDAKGGRA